MGVVLTDTAPSDIQDPDHLATFSHSSGRSRLKLFRALDGYCIGCSGRHVLEGRTTTRLQVERETTERKPRITSATMRFTLLHPRARSTQDHRYASRIPLVARQRYPCVLCSEWPRISHPLSLRGS